MKYVAALDVGTTSVRLYLIDENATTVASSVEKVELLYPKPGYAEIDPEQLWNIIVKVIKSIVNGNGINIESIVSLGISTQRGSFTTWNTDTGKHYHNFITWKDLRADSLVKEWNSSMKIKSLRVEAHLLYTLSRNKRFKAGSVFKLMNTQMTLRLLWALKNIPDLKEAVDAGKAVFGGVDSWLLYKFTGKHVTDISSASATGLYDPFIMNWSSLAQDMFKIPHSIFPKVVDTAGDFGKTPKDLFGVEIPITCSMADQAASLYGSTCFHPGDLKITMGTGTFLNVNTGNEPHASMAGLYPVIGWRIGSEVVYIAEGASNDTGSIIEWAIDLDLVKQASQTSEIANSVNDSDGVYFIPAFSGLQVPINDESAASGFIGIKPTTNKAHLVRSLLESLVFRTILLYDALRKETNYSYDTIRVDGGVSQNDFMMQLLADLSGLKVERAKNTEMSIMGVAYLAGLKSGVWKDKKELSQLRHIDTVFKPEEKRKLQYKSIINQWKKAINRFKKWY